MQNDTSFKKLIRFKDNTFCWTYGEEHFSPCMSEANAIAYGIWHLKLSRKEIDKAIPKLGTSKTQHTFALFSHLNDFLYVDNVKMEECDDNDRQQNR